MVEQNNKQNMYEKWYKDQIINEPKSVEKFRHFLSEQLKNVSLEDKRVLEIGCGKGEVSLFLAMCSNIKQVVALDEALGEGSPVGVTTPLKEAIASFGLENIVVKEIDIMLNNFSDGYFDIIIANNSLHHVHDPRKLAENSSDGYLSIFYELRRLLVPNGILSIWEYSRQSFWRVSPVKWKWKDVDWRLHPTLGEWLSFIRNAGFTLRRCDYKVPYSVRKLEILLQNPLTQFFLYPSFFITAQK